MKLQITTITDRVTWNDTLATLPYSHVLQTWEWGAFKQQTTGWMPARLAFYHSGEAVAAASVLTRSVGPARIMYVPKGPALAYGDDALRAAVITALEQHARRARAIFIKIDPDVVAGRGIPGDDGTDRTDPLGATFMGALARRGWRFSAEQIQFRNTVCIDLARDTDALMAAMKQKTRYNIRLSARKGVTVRDAGPADLETLYELYAVTGARDGFITRPLDYYRVAWSAFMAAGMAHALLAEYEDTPLAHLILFHFGAKAWYFYGASSNQHRNLMAPYALQWAAIRWARARGYGTYDLWGAPDVFDANDRMWGVWRFKRGLGGEVVRHVGAWDYPTNRALYYAYTRLMPRVLGWMKRRA